MKAKKRLLLRANKLIINQLETPKSKTENPNSKTKISLPSPIFASLYAAMPPLNFD
jgi:hypothetical protein